MIDTLWAILPAAFLIWVVWWAAQPESEESLRHLHPDVPPRQPKRRTVKPSDKAPAIEAFLEANFGRSTAITNNTCVSPPFGCGKPIEGFSSPLTAREYRISGLCENCQREIFQGEED
jgi:hypothetical protein